MSARTFFAADVKTRVATTVAEIELQTSAEVVVAVRKISGFYRHTDYLAGIALAVASLLIFLFHPEPFEVDLYPIEAATCFAFGGFTSAFFPALRRGLTSSRLMADNARTAARAAFVDLGVSRTKARSGVLVFISMFERKVEVVTDIGIDQAALGPLWKDALHRLTEAVQKTEFDRFLEALRSMGPALGEALPRASDDVNEIPDEAHL
jgi:putative membrane protein